MQTSSLGILSCKTNLLQAGFTVALQWNQIFQDEMTTTAAIDRLVHHATIIELNTESYRMKAAKVAKNHSHETTKKMEESNVK